MARENKPEVSEKRTEYAFWQIPNATSSVTYSLPVFHEIDFAVNEGYRKIPHGGIEEGGLLFGTIDETGTRIEAFRPIVCEHSSGPSFQLSDHDLELLTEQLANSASDPELEGLHPVGWFLAHTRGPLVLTDREAELFDHYFDHPGMVTVLVKPERFQPTRFGFLVRAADSQMPRDASQTAVILPLPGRNAKLSNRPIPSIPAPTVTASATRRVEPENPPSVYLDEHEPEPLTQQNLALQHEDEEQELPDPPKARRHRGLSLEQVRPRAEELEEHPAMDEHHEELHSPTNVPAMSGRARGSELEPVRLGEVGAAPRENAVARRPYVHDEDHDLTHDPYQQIELLNKRKPASTAARLVMVLPLAALLGCLVGYIAYLQVPSPIIPLSVKGHGQTVIVTWPPEQTRSAVYAAVRVDDSTPVMLTPEERAAGRVEVTATADMKVELIARNWIHDSRGIVRYIKPLANTAP